MRHLLRKLIGWMLCLAMAVGMLPMVTRGAKAADYTDSQGINYTVNASDMTALTASVTRSSGVSGDVIIPASIKVDGQNYAVTSIERGAFYGCTGLTSVNIPSSVNTIGSDAFYICEKLNAVTFKTDSQLTNIGEGAFYECTSLTSITIPNNVTSIGDYTFSHCTGLTSITIPKSVTSIGDLAFYKCTGLTSITIPNSVTSIGDYAFDDCTSLTSITIPNSVTSIGDGAFDGCIGLTSITIPNTVTNISDGAFCNCIGLTSITIPNSVTSIAERVFYGCIGLTSITIPNSVTSIGDYAFYGCTGLTSIIIPNSVTSIGEYAFPYCTGLTSITIPNSVTSIGDYSFFGCTNLTNIFIRKELDISHAKIPSVTTIWRYEVISNTDGKIHIKLTGIDQGSETAIRDDAMGEGYQIDEIEVAGISLICCINNATDLKNFTDRVNNGEPSLSALLLDDIDLSSFENWTPIGTENKPYTGTFDGNGCTIKGLTIKSTDDFIGLFGYVGEGGCVQNVALEGGSIKGSSYVGGVAGYIYLGTVSNCYNTGDVTGSGNYVGGVVGRNHGTVSNCYNTGDVEGKDLVGGVAGYISLGTVSNCYNTGAVSGNDRVGGVAGNNRGIVLNCYYDRNVCVIKGAADANNWKAIGEGSGMNVTGLTTAEMTGDNANTYLKSLTDAEDDNGEKIWIIQDNTFDTYYYLHLAGFEYSKTKDLKDWPAVFETGHTFELSSASFVYNGENQAPTVTVKKDGVAVDKQQYTFTHEESVNIGKYSLTITNTDCGKTKLLTYEIEKRKIEITALNQTFPYNGLNQGTDDVEYMDDEIEGVVSISGTDGLVSTDSLSLITIACQPKTDAGTYKGVLVPKDAQIVNTATGENMTDNYDIKYVPSNLIITPIEVTLTANSGETTNYDGTEKTVSGYKCSVEGLTFDGISAEISATKAGTYEVAFSNVTLNQTTDSTGNYVVSETTNGTLTINKRPLTITAESDTKVYDGTALSNDSVSAEGLADGDKIASVTVTGSQTMTGKSDNVPKNAKIVNAKGEDVTDCYEITYKNGTLTVTKPDSPALDDDQKPAPKNGIKEDGKDQILVLDPANLPEGYTIEYSTDGGKTWKPIPTGKESGEYTIEVFYKADENHTDFFGDTLNVIIQGVYNQTESDGDWTKGSGKTYTFRIKKAFNDEATYDNLTGVFVDGKKAEPGKDYTPAKGSAIITFAADYLETLSVGEHKIRVTFKDGETSVVLKILAAIATPTPTPAVDATPVTGDSANPFLWAAMILLSMAFAAGIVMRRRKQA